VLCFALGLLSDEICTTAGAHEKKTMLTKIRLFGGTNRVEIGTHVQLEARFVQLAQDAHGSFLPMALLNLIAITATPGPFGKL